MVKNITKEARERELTEMNEDLLKIMPEIKDYAIFMLDSEGYMISWNAGAEQLYGYGSEEIIGKHIAVLYIQADVEAGQPEAHLKEAACTGRYEFEIRNRKKDGREFYTNTVLNAFYDSDNKTRGFAKITHNIDVKKRLEKANRELYEQLEEKVNQRTKELVMVNKELEAFSYSVSHDLRVPLRAISGYGNLLKKRYQAEIDEEGNRIIDVIVDKTKMMGQLIDDLLAFSKMARLHVVEQRINMKKMAENCLAQLLQDEGGKNCKVVITDMPECSGDENMLKQVWFNLLNNAIKYSSKTLNPMIEAGSKEDEKKCIYYVKDNGVGFDMKYAGNLFGVFQRLHRQDEFEGTGIGLALIKRIITKHGGEIWADAKVNNGATFSFSIPKSI